MKPEDILGLVGEAIGRHQKEMDQGLRARDETIAGLATQLAALAAEPVAANVADRLDAIEVRLSTMLEDARAADDELEGRLQQLETMPRPRDGRDGVSMAFLGKWEAEREYRRGDVVAWEGCSWGCREPTEAGQQPGEHGAWEVIALRGNRGRPGERGLQGEEGRPGPIGQLVAAGIEDSALILADAAGGRYTLDLSPMIAAIGAAVERDIEARLEPIETALRKGSML